MVEDVVLTVGLYVPNGKVAEQEPLSVQARNSLRMAELNRQLAALSVWNEQLNRRLAVRESGDSRQSAIAGRTVESERKRQRS